MNKYAKLIGCTSTKFCLTEAGSVSCYEQVSADECPDGFKLLECVKPYPTPQSGEELAFEIEDVGDKIIKTGVIVAAGTRFVSDGPSPMGNISMISPDGQQWALAVNNDGTMYTYIKE